LSQKSDASLVLMLVTVSDILDLGMTIGLRPDVFPQKITTMGRVKPRFHGSEFYPQI